MQTIRIRDLLARRKDVVFIQDNIRYKRVTIRINHNGVCLRNEEIGKKIGTKRQFITRAGDFILSRIDARHAAFGIVPEELEGAIITNDFWSFEINKDLVELDYFYIFSQSQEFLEACKRASKGTTNRKRIEEDFFMNYEFELPNKETQQLLVQAYSRAKILQERFLEECTNQQRLIARLKQSILSDAIHGTLVSQDPNDEPASSAIKILKQEKEYVISSMKMRKQASQFSVTHEKPYIIPSGWEWSRIGEIFCVGTGATPARMDYSYFGGTINWLTSTETGRDFIEKPTEMITEKAIEETNCRVFPPGTLIVAMYGQGKTRGQVSELKIPAATNQACAAILFGKSGEKVKDYIKIFFKYNYLRLRELAEGGAQPNLNLVKIKKYPVPIPPFNEQIRIAEMVSRMLCQFELLVSQRKTQLLQLNRLRGLLLHNLFQEIEN